MAADPPLPGRALHGRTALVTGGASGLGLATGRKFAACGGTVIICDVDGDAAQAAAAELGGDHLAVCGDVSDETAVATFVALAQRHRGHIDIVVNSAGVSDTFVPTVEQDPSHWRRLIDVNLTGTFLVSHAVAPAMIERRSGVILNLNSIAGLRGLPVRSAYSASKAGVGMLTQVLACEWAPFGVRVNAIAPGYIRTPLTDALIRDGKIDETSVRRRTPMGQFGRPEHIADAMAFLASDDAAFITGVTLPVDGGYCAWGAPSDAYPYPLD
jgi:NAD(P)-dependent dehydrogenase (short-subunit alcohol dehydrogenase family)